MEKEVPNDLYVEIDGKRTLMNKLSAAKFSYVFHQPRKNVGFRLNGNGYNSSSHELKVLPKPSVVGFDVSLEFPKYINRPDENRENNGDLLIPEGTKVTWDFNTNKTDKLGIVLQDESVELNRNGENSFSFSEQFRKSSEYTVIGSNEFLKSGDSLRYTVTVVPDAAVHFRCWRRRLTEPEADVFQWTGERRLRVFLSCFQVQAFE